jgi:hypothetical protein
MTARRLAQIKMTTGTIDGILAMPHAGAKNPPRPSARFAEPATSRKELTDAGRKAEAVAKFPPRQVVLAHNPLRYEILVDEMTAAVQVPHADTVKVMTAVCG